MADIISSKALASQRILRVDDNLNTGVNNLIAYLALEAMERYCTQGHDIATFHAFISKNK